MTNMEIDQRKEQGTGNGLIMLNDHLSVAMNLATSDIKTEGIFPSVMSFFKSSYDLSFLETCKSAASLRDFNSKQVAKTCKYLFQPFIMTLTL